MATVSKGSAGLEANPASIVERASTHLQEISVALSNLSYEVDKLHLDFDRLIGQDHGVVDDTPANRPPTLSFAEIWSQLPYHLKDLTKSVESFRSQLYTIIYGG